MIYPNVRRHFKLLYNGILGIGVEVFMTAFFIAAGFVVCVLWWGLFQ